MKKCNNRCNLEIYFVRHGESYGNVEIEPKPDFKKDNPPLTPNGLNQAQMLAVRFEKGDIDCIFASSLIRTAQTVHPVAEKLGLDIHILPDLMEVDTTISGADDEEYRQKAPLVVIGENLTAGSVLPCGPENEESRWLRAQKCIDYLIETCRGKKILVATHGTFYSYLIKYLLGQQPPEEFYIKVRNCSITHVILTEGRAPALNTANDISHLNPYGFGCR